jgi:hypothetical protein
MEKFPHVERVDATSNFFSYFRPIRFTRRLWARALGDWNINFVTDKFVMDILEDGRLCGRRDIYLNRRMCLGFFVRFPTRRHRDL